MTEPTPKNGTDKLAEALAKAQGEIEMPERNKTVEVRMKSGNTYTFKYATLDNIIDTVRGPLSKNGLWFVQLLHGEEGGKREVETILLHESGQSIKSRMPILMSDSGNQALGSAVSYMRRYALTSMLGIAAEDDDDANIVDDNTVSSKDNQAFGGPLKKTELKNKMREMAGKLAQVEDMGTFVNLQNEYVEVIDQCIRDLPEWYYGKKSTVNGQVIQEKGAYEAIEAKRQELAEADPSAQTVMDAG